MSDQWRIVDRMLDELEAALPASQESLSMRVQRNDWRPIWALVGSIGAQFKGVRYPSSAAQQAAWTRFTELRTTASKRADHERSKFEALSTHHRDTILYACKGLGYSRVGDMMFFFDPTTAQDMKDQGRRLADAMQMLKAHKGEMLAAHKQECFERFQDIRAQFDRYWEQRKQAVQERHETAALKRENFRQRVEANLEKNREKLRAAEQALERQRDRADSLRSQISETDSSKWRGIWSEWLDQTQTKISDIEDSIRRIRGWIEEDEQLLANARR